VPKRVLQDLGPGKNQKPFAVIEGYRADELVLSVRDARAAQSQGQSGATVTNPGASSGDTGSDSSSRETGISLPGNSLAGTSWSGASPDSGEYVIKFLKNGEMYYIVDVMENGTIVPTSTKGKWTQSGKDVRMTIGSAYSVMIGTVEGNVMKGEASNREGASWKWTLFKKE